VSYFTLALPDIHLEIPVEENENGLERVEKQEQINFPKAKPQRFWRQSTEDFYLSTSSSGRVQKLQKVINHQEHF